MIMWLQLATVFFLALTVGALGMTVVYQRQTIQALEIGRKLRADEALTDREAKSLAKILARAARGK